MFTLRFFIILGICILMAVLSMVWPPLLPLVKAVLVALGCAWLLDLVSVVAVSRRIKVSRECGECLSLDQPNAVTLSVSLKPMPGFLARNVSFDALDVVPYDMRVNVTPEISQAGSMTYYVTPTCRGRHEWRRVRLCTGTRFPGLVRSVRFVKLETVVKVYPTFHRLDKLELMADQHTNAGQKRMRRPGNSTEFEQIRAYVPGDDVRTINWKATARATSLMVNTYTEERSKPIIPVVCAGPSMLTTTEGISLLDRAVSASVALASSALRHYDEAGIITVTHSGVQSYMKPERAPSTLSKILDATYEFGLPPTESELEFVDDPDVLPDGIDAQYFERLKLRVESTRADADYDALANFALATLKRRSLLVLFANFENIAIAETVLPSLVRVSRRHNLVVVLFEDEGVLETANAPYRKDAVVSDSLSEQRFRSVCASYIDQQKALAEYLRKHGINVIITHPKGLSAAVLQSYLEIKSRGGI